MTKESFDSFVRQCEPILQELVEQGLNLAIATVEDIAKQVSTRLSKGKNIDSVISAIKYAWRYEEKHVDNYSLEQAIKWFKENLPKNKNIKVSGCLFKKEDKQGIHLYHCFIDLERRIPLLGSGYPYCVVYTLEVDRNLIRQFNDKHMLVFN